MGTEWISSLRRYYRFSIGFMFGEFPAQGSRLTAFLAHQWSKEVVMNGDVILLKSSITLTHLILIYGKKRFSSAEIYFSVFIVSSMMNKRLVP